jgi:cytochrome c553
MRSPKVSLVSVMSSLWFALWVGSIGALGGCGKNTEPPAPTSGSPNAQPESGPGRQRAAGGSAVAEQVFATACAMCHGTDGSGKGPAAAALTPQPRDYRDPAWQASVTDEQLKETIVKGGQAVGKSPMMPGKPELASQPEVLDGLVAIIRGFAKPARP